MTVNKTNSHCPTLSKLRPDCPEGTLGRFLLDTQMSVKELSNLTGIATQTINKHLVGHINLPISLQKEFMKLGVYDFNAGNLRINEPKKRGKRTVTLVDDEDQQREFEIIKKISHYKSGIIKLDNHKQVIAISEWLDSRGYDYKHKKENDYYKLAFRKRDKNEIY